MSDQLPTDAQCLRYVQALNAQAGRTEHERQAAEISEVVRSRAEDAIRYCEAYEGRRKTVVIDGSMFSPSSRAIPGMENAYQSMDDEDWYLLDEIVQEAIDAYELDEDTDGSPESWSLTWDDGMLVASLPDLED
jgi:hypothetical protein